MWTPDAYEGAPTPTTGFMAAGVKIGGFAALLKIFVGTFATQRLATAPYGWTSVVAIIALATMIIGNFAAVKQTNVKRLLAYSSIAHVGYLLVGVVAAANFYGHAFAIGSLRPADQIEWSRLTGDFSVAAVVFYVLTYAVATLGAFACVSWHGANKQEGVTAHEWSGLAQRHPAMALGLTVCLLSLMGMPPTVGFFGKLGLFRAALENDNMVLRVLVVAALVNSVVGAYYYLKLIVAMYFRPSPGTEIGTLPGRGARVVVGICAVTVLALGIGADAAFRRAELASAGFAFAAGSEARADRVEKLRDKWDAQDEAADAAKNGDAKNGDAKADAKAADAQADAKAADAKAVDAKAADAKAPADAKAEPTTAETEAKMAAAKAAALQARQAKARGEAKAAEAKAGEAKAPDAKAPGG
jgi:formate hydrogenlyase subunit 3/multisubunit Na+/H+ antiporter MnhD subunit